MSRKVVKKSSARKQKYVQKGPASKDTSSKLKNKKPAPKKEEDSDSEDVSDIEVNFELYNMAESDYHSVKQYLANEFGATEHGVDLVGLTTFICEDLADHVGTCIKTDGENSDPFGFLSGLSLSLMKSAQNGSFEKTRSSLVTFLNKKLEGFDAEAFMATDSKNVMLFFERLINVPVSIAAPLFQQFLDDWKRAAAEEPHHFAHPKQVLLLTPTYREIESQLDKELGLPGSSKSGFVSVEKGDCFYYPEVEFLAQFAEQSWTFTVNTGHETSDSRRAFSDAGIEPARKAYLFSWDAFEKYVEFLLEKSFD